MNIIKLVWNVLRQLGSWYQLGYQNIKRFIMFLFQSITKPVEQLTKEEMNELHLVRESDVKPLKPRTPEPDEW